MPRPVLRSRRGALLALAVAALAACTTVPPAPTAAGADLLSGRLAVRVEPLGNEAARSLSAAFDLRGDSRAGTLGLSTPLGSLLAQARWAPGDVVLVTPRETRRFASLDELTREALGESVPIEAWFDWLRGRPWPGAPSERRRRHPPRRRRSFASSAGASTWRASPRARSSPRASRRRRW